MLKDDVCRKRGLVIKVAVIFLPFDKHGHFDAGLNLFRLFCADAWIWLFKLCPVLVHPRRPRSSQLRRLNTVLVVCEYMSFAKSWQGKGCSSQAETWQVKNVLMKDFEWQVKFDVVVVSMATWTIEYNLKISFLFSLHKICSLDFPINLQTAYYN